MDEVRRLITARTVGIVAVHVFGLPADIESLEDLAAEHGLSLVFDAAHGLGGSYDGKVLGAFWRCERFQPERHQAGDRRRGGNWPLSATRKPRNGSATCGPMGSRPTTTVAISVSTGSFRS